MKITGVLRDSCPNGIDCDKVYELDGGDDVLVRGRYLTAEQAAELGITLPPHEGLLLVDRSMVGEV